MCDINPTEYYGQRKELNISNVMKYKLRKVLMIILFEYGC